MEKKKKIVLISSIALVAIILLIGVTYALSYTQTSSNQQLILGDIWMNYAESNSLTIEDAIPGSDYTNYFEFVISGTNTYTKKDIWYEIVLTKGETPDEKDENYRIPDKYIKFKLVSVDTSNQETEIFTDKKYGDLTNKRIHVETIAKNTPEVNKTYRLYMTIDNSLVIGNTSNAIYGFDEWDQAFASIKVNVTGDFNEKEIQSDLNTAGTIKANVVPYAVSSASDFAGGLVAINGTEGDDYGLLYNENNNTHTIREYRYSGADVDNYIYYNCPDTDGTYNYGDLDYDYANNCETWRIVGIFNENGEEFLKIMNNNTLTDIPTTYVIDGTTYTVGENGTSAYWNNPDTLKSTNYNDWTMAGLQYYLNTEHDESGTPVEGYLSSLSTNAKNLIRETTYYLGNVTIYESNFSATAMNTYVNERGSVECASGIIDFTNIENCNFWYNNEPIWNGKVSLLYPSDFGYSITSNYWNNGFEKNWDYGYISMSWMQQTLNHTSSEWFLSPSSSTTNGVICWNLYGNVATCNVGSNNGVRPVLNLKSNTKVLKGDGDVNSPYVVIAG